MPTAPWATLLPSNVEMLESCFDEFYTALRSLETRVSTQDSNAAVGVIA